MYHRQQEVTHNNKNFVKTARGWICERAWVAQDKWEDQRERERERERELCAMGKVVRWWCVAWREWVDCEKDWQPRERERLGRNCSCLVTCVVVAGVVMWVVAWSKVAKGGLQWWVRWVEEEGWERGWVLRRQLFYAWEWVILQLTWNIFKLTTIFNWTKHPEIRKIFSIEINTT